MFTPIFGRHSVGVFCLKQDNNTSSSPYCVAPSPNTSTGLPYFANVKFQNAFCSKSHLNCN
jgi:hypothetical protein